MQWAADMQWAYGVTTVPERADHLLPQTLRSLAAAGFDQPRLFVDGDNRPRVGQLLNWMHALYYLFTTSTAERIAIFEDDILACRHLREYLEREEADGRIYWNLLTHDENLPETGERPGWHASNQLGRGAAGLVFDRPTAEFLLRDAGFLRYPASGGTMADAAVVRSLRQVGYRELVHYPSLIQHVGIESTLGHHHGGVRAFLGVDYDLLALPVSPRAPRVKRCRYEPEDGYMVCRNEGCGNRVRIIDPLLPPEKYQAGPCGKKKKQAAVECRHRGAAEALPVLMQCETCQGNVRKKYVVHACAIHGRCLPTFRGEVQDGLHQCQGCADYSMIPTDNLEPRGEGDHGK